MDRLLRNTIICDYGTRIGSVVGVLPRCDVILELCEFIDIEWIEMSKDSYYIKYRKQLHKQLEKLIKKCENLGLNKPKIRFQKYKSNWFPVKSQSTRCCGLTKKKSRCKRMVKGSTYCYNHLSQNKYDHEKCCICMEEIGYDKKMLKCDHTFHSNCVNEWFMYNHTCPLCRK
jgi:DNA-directed RNA polymerase beta' subunit